MKKILPILALTATLAGCSQPHTEPLQPWDRSQVSIVTPTGAPALGFYGFVSSSNFATNTDPSLIVGMMNAGQKDVVVLPTNAGVSAIVNKNAPYKIATTITFGNFYVASLNNDDNGVMDANDTILLFQKNNVPDKLFHYVYGDDFNANIYYVSTVNDVAVAVRDGYFNDEQGNKHTPNYVLTAEPSLTALVSQNKVTKYADIQELYRQKTDNKEIFQASVFLKNTVDSEIGNGFLDTLKEDIDAAIRNSDVLLAGMNKSEDPSTVFGVAPQMAANVLKNGNGMGLGFKKAKDNKAAIDQFLTLFNINETDEGIYF